LRTLVASLWNGVRDLSLPQPAATAWVEEGRSSIPSDERARIAASDISLLQSTRCPLDETLNSSKRST
jgi:hypothetical protein